MFIYCENYYLKNYLCRLLIQSTVQANLRVIAYIQINHLNGTVQGESNTGILFNKDRGYRVLAPSFTYLP